MTLANQLTMARLAMALAACAALMAKAPALHVAALLLFILAMITDWLDGYVARKTGSISPFGKVADPIADKILVLGALIGLSRAHVGVPLWAVFLIMARELVMGGVRVLTISQQGKILAAEKWGKLSMVFQSTSVLIMIAVLVAREMLPGGLPEFLRRLPYPLTLACVASAWGSAFMYFRQSRQLLEKSWG